MSDLQLSLPYRVAVTIRWEVIRCSVPTWLTMLRMFAPVYLGALLLRQQIMFFTFIAIAAALTDWLDGYLARKWKCETERGAELDIYADKILCFVLMGAVLANPLSTLCVLPIGLLVLYHAVVIYRRVFSSLLFTSSRIAKFKMLVEMPSLIMSVGSLGFLHEELNDIGRVGIWCTAALAAWSMLRYLYPEKIPDWPASLWPRKS